MPLAFIAAVSKAMLLINPGMFAQKTLGGLSAPMLALLVSIITILTLVYFAFYFPRNKIKERPEKKDHSWLLGLISGLVAGIAFSILANIYIGILIGVALGIFIRDCWHYKDRYQIFASFNACFVNVLLFVGFAFGGINKLYSLVTGITKPLIPMEINKMSFGVGILLLILGCGAIYSSRTATGAAIVDYFIKNKLRLSNIWQAIKSMRIEDWLKLIAVFSVALQAAYQSYAPIASLLSSWGLHAGISAPIAIVVCVTTFMAVFALLNPSRISSDKRQKSSSFWYAMSFAAATLTGVSTVPLANNVASVKIAFWSLIAVFSGALWGYQFLNRPPADFMNNTSQKKLQQLESNSEKRHVLQKCS